MTIPTIILQEYYPEYRKQAPLPSDLLELCISFLIEEKKEYHSNGKLLYQGTYVNGEKHGEWKTWWHNSEQLWKQGTYVNGKQHGEWKMWYRNGKLWKQGTYVNGKQHGEWKAWNRNGKLKSKETYVNGVLQIPEG